MTGTSTQKKTRMKIFKIYKFLLFFIFKTEGSGDIG